MDLTERSFVRCDIKVPEAAKFVLQAANGKFEVEKPHFDLDLSAANGKVEFKPDEDHAYKYSISVANGKTDSFTSSDKPGAHEIKIKLTNGKISRDSED